MNFLDVRFSLKEFKKKSYVSYGMRVQFFLILTFVMAYFPPLLAEESLHGYTHEVGLSRGRILPHKIEEMTENQSLWGVYFAHRVGQTTLEWGGYYGKENGVEWTNAALSFRWDLQVHSLVLYSILGLDYIQYKAHNDVNLAVGSAHLGGGIITSLTERLWLRLGIKYNVRPGTSLFLGGGFVIPIGDQRSGASVKESEPVAFAIENEESPF